MKTTKLTIIFILFSTVSFACSCDWGGNFISTAKNADLVVLAKVVQHNFHLEKNGKTFSSLEEAVEETFKSEYDNETDFYESIDLEILEVIKGRETRKIIRIFASDGADCRSGVRNFETGKTYLFTPTLSKYSLTDMPNEKETDFFLWSCSETSIEYRADNNKVYGLIKGKSNAKKPIQYDYAKLLRKIT
ncbi:hypothetical protein HC174_16390 [Salinimicrobium sp. CDJ15-81-2]|nr:hypothetical protein [Salinimicrobium nanhaiense]